MCAKPRVSCRELWFILKHLEIEKKNMESKGKKRLRKPKQGKVELINREKQESKKREGRTKKGALDDWVEKCGNIRLCRRS